MIDFCLTDDFPGEPEKDKVAINVSYLMSF